MSNAPPIPPQPPPISTPTVTPVWVKTAMSVLLLITGLLAGPHVVPDTSPPAPKPVPPIHQTTPDDQRRPDTTPAPSPPPVVANEVVIADVNGTRLGGLVDPGQLVVVTSSSLDIVGIPVPPASAEVFEVSSNKILCTIKAGGKVEVICYGAGKPSVTMISAGQGAQPPPPQNVIPQQLPVPPTPVIVDPVPQPQQLSKKLVISVVEDAGNRPPGVASLLNNFTTWNKYKEAGHVWMLFPQNTSEARGTIAVNALKAANVTVPGIVIQDAQTSAILYAGTLSGVKLGDITALVNKYTGSNL